MMEDWALSTPVSRISGREGMSSLGSNHGLGCSKGLDREWQLRVFKELMRGNTSFFINWVLKLRLHKRGFKHVCFAFM